MDPLASIAIVVSNPLTIGAVVGILMLWTGVSLCSLTVKTAKLVEALRRAQRLLEGVADQTALIGQYEALNAELERQDVLGARWRAFRESLLLPIRPGQPIGATDRPDAWFGVDLLRAPGVGVDPRYHAAMPNLLVGAGLLFTFLGLAVALASASGIVAGAVSTRSDALRTLLDTASFKFITSLAGMFLSILYTLYRKWRLYAVDVALDEFNAVLEQLIPTVSPLALQREQLAVMEKQAIHLETFSNDLAVSIGSAIDQTFNERLAEHIGPLTHAMRRLSERMDSQNEDALERLLDAFLAKLEGGASDHMRDVAKSLTGLTERMEGMVEAVQVAAVQTRDAGTEAGSVMAERMGAAAESLKSAVERISATLAEAMTGIQKRMGEEADATAARLLAQLEAMVDQLRALAEASRTAGGEAFEALVARVADAAGTFESAAVRVATELERSAGETGAVFGRGAEHAVGRIVAATEGMQQEMRLLLSELQSSVREAGDSLRDGGQQSAEAIRTTLDDASGALATALDEAAQRVASAGDQAGSALERGGTGASERLVAAADVIGSGASELARHLTHLAETADKLAERARAFERAAGEATQPLASSASDLKAASASAREALAPLAQSTEATARAVEQVASAAARLEAAGRAADQFSSSLNDAAQRFEGVDQELARTLGGLQVGLQSFTRQVSEFVVGTDNNLAKAATQLANLVKSLEDTLEDHAPRTSSAGGH